MVNLLVNREMAPSIDVASKARLDRRPYLAGAGIGVLSWAVFAIADDPLGITTALSALAGFTVIPFAGAGVVQHNSYWAQNVPGLSYGTLFLLGVILGALAASVMTMRFRLEAVPLTWRRRFGPSPMRRFTAAFVGGAIEMYGARLAGGCASGHGISGTLQLALSSWIFTILMFTTAILFGRYVFREVKDRS